MPRERKQTARFDPSPEAVAPWNDTSGVVRKHVDLLARVRHRLTETDEELLAKANAAEAALLSKPTKPRVHKQQNGEGGDSGSGAKLLAGKKRPRPTITAAGSTGDTDPNQTERGSSSHQRLPYVGWPRLADLRQESDGRDVRGGKGQRGGGAGGYGPRHAARAVSGSTTYSSSLSPGTSSSGSDSDSDCSYASVMSHKNLPWRRPMTTAPVRISAARRRAALAVEAAGGISFAVRERLASLPLEPVTIPSIRSGTASDTDSEYDSTGDMISPLSDVSSGCSAASVRSARGEAGRRGGARKRGGTRKGGGVRKGGGARMGAGARIGASAHIGVSPPSGEGAGAGGVSDVFSGDCTASVRPPPDGGVRTGAVGGAGGLDEEDDVDDGIDGTVGIIRDDQEQDQDDASRPAAGAAPTGANVESSEQNNDESPRKKRMRNVVTVRLAKSEMPVRFAKLPLPFQTCLDEIAPEDRVGTDVRSGGMGMIGGSEEDGGDGDAAVAAVQGDAMAHAAAMLMALDPSDGAGSNSWLSSVFIDVVLTKFARTYSDVHFMPCEFAKLELRSPVYTGKRTQTPPIADVSSSTATSSSSAGPAAACGGGSEKDGLVAKAAAAFTNPNRQYKDILGRPIVYSERRSVVFLTHVNNVHWNLLRVEHAPVPELQLFEPMGKPPPRRGHQAIGGYGGEGGTTRARGTGFRCIPKAVYEWLDEVWPLNGDGYVDDGQGCTGGANVQGRSTSPTPGGGTGSVTGKRTRSTDNAEGSGIARGGGAKRSRPNAASSSVSASCGNDGGGWYDRAYSAITQQQQTTGFDCGVATLLYAEKCGQGQMRQDVNAWTTQADMTAYRVSLQEYVKGAISEPQASSVSVAQPAAAKVATSPPSPQAPPVSVPLAFSESTGW